MSVAKVSTSAKALSHPRAQHADPTNSSFGRSNSRNGSPARPFASLGRSSSYTSPSRASVASKVDATVARLREEEELWDTQVQHRHHHQAHVKHRAEEISAERRRAAERQFQDDMERSRERCFLNDEARRKHNDRVHDWYKKRQSTVAEQKAARQNWEHSTEERLSQQEVEASVRHHQFLRQRSEQSYQRRMFGSAKVSDHLHDIADEQHVALKRKDEASGRKAEMVAQTKESQRLSAQHRGHAGQQQVHRNVLRAQRIEAERQAAILRKLEEQEVRSSNAKAVHYLQLESRRDQKERKAKEAGEKIRQANEARIQREATVEEDFECKLAIGEYTRVHNQRVYRPSSRKGAHWF